MDDETWLEIGLGALLLSILLGIAAWLGSRAVEGGRAHKNKAKPSPARGSISAERHENISANPAR